MDTKDFCIDNILSLWKQVRYHDHKKHPVKVLFEKPFLRPPVRTPSLVQPCPSSMMKGKQIQLAVQIPTIRHVDDKK